MELVSEKASITDNSQSRYVKELLAVRFQDAGKKYLSDVGKGTPEKKATKVIDQEVEKLKVKIKNKKLNLKNALKLLEEITCPF